MTVLLCNSVTFSYVKYTPSQPSLCVFLFVFLVLVLCLFLSCRSPARSFPRSASFPYLLYLLFFLPMSVFSPLLPVSVLFILLYSSVCQCLFYFLFCLLMPVLFTLLSAHVCFIYSLVCPHLFYLQL